MSDLRTFALRAAALKALADRVNDELVMVRAELVESMLDVGADSTAARLPDGTAVAKLSLAGGTPSAYVADRRAFLGWVREHRPDEIEEKVRPSYEKAVLDEAKRNGVVVPGVELKDGTPYTTCRFDPDGRDHIAAAWRDRVLDLGTVVGEIR